MTKTERIWWYDPTGQATWHSMEDIKQLEPARCVTVAQVVYETDKWVVTSASWSNLEGSDTEYSDITVIPKGCIERRQILDLTFTDEEEEYFDNEHDIEEDNNDMANKQL